MRARRAVRRRVGQRLAAAAAGRAARRDRRPVAGAESVERRRRQAAAALGRPARRRQIRMESGRGRRYRRRRVQSAAPVRVVPDQVAVGARAVHVRRSRAAAVAHRRVHRAAVRVRAERAGAVGEGRADGRADVPVQRRLLLRRGAGREPADCLRRLRVRRRALLPRRRAAVVTEQRRDAVAADRPRRGRAAARRRRLDPRGAVRHPRLAAGLRAVALLRRGAAGRLLERNLFEFPENALAGRHVLLVVAEVGGARGRRGQHDARAGARLHRHHALRILGQAVDQLLQHVAQPGPRRRFSPDGGRHCRGSITFVTVVLHVHGALAARPGLRLHLHVPSVHRVLAALLSVLSLLVAVVGFHRFPTLCVLDLRRMLRVERLSALPLGNPARLAAQNDGRRTPEIATHLFGDIPSRGRLFPTVLALPR